MTSEGKCTRCDGTGINRGGRRCGLCGGDGREAPPVEGSQSQALVDSRAHMVAALRLTAARGSIYEAFDNMACGIDHEQAVDYLSGSPAFESLPEGIRGKVAGMVLGFALTAVESDRLLRKMGQRQWLGGSQAKGSK